jgi:hypothetical protein
MTVDTIVTLSGQAVIMITAILGYLSTRNKVKAVDDKVTKVHKAVNGQLDRQLTYNGQLAATLTASGVTVPPQDPPAPTSENTGG